jgi:hypothetical protein
MASATSRTPYGSRPEPKSLVGHEAQRSGNFAVRIDRILTTVVLPAPLEPSRAKMLPRSTSKSTGAALICTVNLTNERSHPTTGFFRPHQLDRRVSGA